MMDPKIYEKTRQLVKALNLFVAHVFCYFLANIMLSLYAFRDISNRWGWLFLIVCWAIILIYHGIRIYGIDPIEGKRSPRLLSVMLKSIGA